MALDYGRKNEVAEEIALSIKTQLRKSGMAESELDQVAQKLMSLAIWISPPEEQVFTTELIVMNTSARGGGRSTKPGNIRLNLRPLLEAVAGGVLTVESLDNLWMMPFALLVLWSSLQRTTEVALSESDAVTILAMWQAAKTTRVAELTDIKTNVDAHALKYQRNTLSLGEIRHSIKNLTDIGSVALITGQTDSWAVYEELSLSYR
ncbi:hypothetical protein M1M11_29825 [Pseudomonas azerbaijanoccidens]|jgi:hypothetical protein|uniref:hypothetical protein n=1 Tax=Pseudomonas azerbaijanoccidentalis TaxID=2842347 RepID=UPI00200B7F63|nr:hypothetical protein [Pseudomonas azerbaijanoccidentalis]MCK8669080.1 hypothetical protein [Pseudomonas azerbaijanoccidentalis]